MFDVDSSSPTPIYAQLDRAIRASIATGELEAGERGEGEPGDDQGGPARASDEEEPDHQHHDPDQDHQLDQRKRAPGRRRALALESAPGRA